MNPNINTNKELTQRRERQVWELRIQCWSQAQIAEHLGITQGAVSQILKRVGTRLFEQFSENAHQMIAEQTEQLLRIAQEALAAFQQSKQQPAPLPPEESQTLETQTPSESGTGGQTDPSPPSLRSGLGKGAGGLGTAAKPAYLRLAIQALAAVRSLHGFNRPYQPEVVPYNDNVKMLIGVDLDRMKYKDGTPVPRKEVDRLMALQEQ